MSEAEKTVFISYRRNVSSFIARAVFMDLREHGYDVFMDVESIDSGQFDTIILNQIAARAHFLIILTGGTLERCVEPGDWLRREIERAMELQRNIVPVLVNDFKFDEVAKSYLTGKLAELTRYNALSLPHDYFEAGMEKLRTRFLKQPMVGTIQETPHAERVEVQQRIAEIASPPKSKGKKLSAADYYNRGIELNDNSDEELAAYTEAIRLNPRLGEAYSNRGSVRQAQGDLAGALIDYNEAIRLNPRDAEAYNNRGTVREAQGDLVGALADYDEALRLGPSATRYFNRGIARKAQGDLEGALADYSEAIRLNPSDAEAYFKRGSVLYDLVDYDGALADYNEVIRLSPQFAEAYNSRGVARQELRDWEGTLADYSEAIRLNPLYAEAYCNRGKLRRDQKDFDGALADYNEAIRLNPQFTEAFLGRGSTRYIQGDFDGSLADYSEVIRLNPLDGYSWRGDMYKMQGKVREAIADYQKYVDLGGTSSWVKEKLAELKKKARKK